MSEIAAGLGSFICDTALEIGLQGAQMVRCSEIAAHQRLGYTAAALLLVAAVAGARWFGRWA